VTAFDGLDSVKTNAAFLDTKYNINFDLTNQTFTVNTTFVANDLLQVNETTNILFDLSACICSDSSFACTAPGSIQPVNQNEWLNVCIKPNVTSVNITNLNLELANPAVAGYSYMPVDFGTGTWRTDDLTTVDTGVDAGIDVVRAKVFLVERLFEAGNTVVVSGNAFMAVKVGARTMEFKPYDLELDINTDEEEECSGFFATLLNFFK